MAAIDKKNKEQVYKYGGQSFPLNDPNIVNDFITNEVMHIEEAVERFATTMNIHPIEGLMEILTWKYTKEPIVKKDHGNLLKYRGGSTVWIIPNPTILGGGILTGDTELGHVLHDNWSRQRIELNKKNPIKFRPFNNSIRLFNEYDNPHLHPDDIKALIQRDFDYGTRTTTNKIFEGQTYTFGIELETCSGRLDEDEVDGLNLKCEFDGSLRDTPDQRKEDVLGGEYITGILTGDAGMFQLQKICNILSKKCAINAKCGVHVHVGTINFNKENIVYMYMLGLLLEQEILSTLPRSRRNNPYCRNLKPLDISASSLNNCKSPLGYKLLIEEYYNKVFKEVSGGKLPSKSCLRTNNHPMGNKCGYNKESQRYCWLNFCTAMFDTKQAGKESATLEFRNHPATLNYNKVKNWVKLCVAFVNFAENHQHAIKTGQWIDKFGTIYPINLETILNATYPRTGKLVIEYLEARKEQFKYDDGKVEEKEYATDKEGVRDLTIKEAVCAS